MELDKSEVERMLVAPLAPIILTAIGDQLRVNWCAPDEHPSRAAYISPLHWSTHHSRRHSTE